MTNNARRNRRKILFPLIAAILAIFVMEVGLHVAYVLVKHRWAWQRSEEVFRVGDYVRRVDDARYVTTKPGYTNPRFTDGTEPWSIRIDSHGFRTGANQASERWPNIVVIGDSQPFGYRVRGEDSYPSRLQEILRQHGDPRGVINAAVPSYSLDQAVRRYQYEIAGRYDVQVVILQIYDPVTQFVLLGREWNVRRNWVTFRKPPVAAFRYSALWQLYVQFAELYQERAGGFEPGDKVAVAKFVDSLNESLESLMKIKGNGVEKVILLPATSPLSTWHAMSDAHRTAMTILNGTLRKFAETHPNVEFIDTNALFAADTTGIAFIDDCCHLSREGAERVARVLAEHLPPLPDRAKGIGAK